MIWGAVVVVVVGCGGGGSGVPKCVPGDSKVCSGPGACVGSQVCAADGTYGTCVCGAAAGSGGGAGTTSSVAGSGGSGGSGGAAGGAGSLPDAAADDAPASDARSPGLDATSDAPDASDSSTDVPAAWTPGALGAPLAVWFDDTMGLAAGHWADQSGRNPPNDAFGQPAALTVAKGALNGLDALAMGFGPNLPGLLVGSNDAFRSVMSIALVVKANTSGQGGALWVQENDPIPGDHLCTIGVAGPNDANAGGAYEVKCYGPTSQTPFLTITTTGHNYADGLFHVVILRFYGSMPGVSLIDSAELRIDNDAPISSTSALGISVPAGNGTLGGLTGGTLSAEVAEVVGVEGSLSMPDVSHLLDYFKRKFALAY